MSYSLCPITFSLVPFTGPSMKFESTLRLFVFEVRPEDVGEEVVIAVPTALIVERDNKEVSTLESTYHRFAIATSDDGIAEWPAQPIKNAGVQKEHPDLVRYSLQYFLNQIVHDVSVVACELCDEGCYVVSPLH